MKWSLEKKFTFEAAHFLPHHDGKCKRVHGHSWVGWLRVEGKALKSSGPKVGMLLDYSALKSWLNPLVDTYLDHHFLNNTLPGENPTSEQVARWVHHRLSGLVPKSFRYWVTIEETCSSRCTYGP